MHSSRDSSDQKPTLFFLHYLGGSGVEWSKLIQSLSNKLHFVTIDLPGFGSSAAKRGYAVSDMVEMVAGVVRSNAPERWLVIGHSMGAKVATGIARRAEDGEAGLQGLVGLILIAGSPPSPEPMDASQRENMKGWFRGNAQSSLLEAGQFIENNVSRKLDVTTNERAVSDVLRTNPEAWVAWLDSGSREDWSQHIGLLESPALLIAGADDENLGPDAQHTLMAPHFKRVELLTLPNAKHLLPLECPVEVAEIIQNFAGSLIGDLCLESGVSHAYCALINSNRTGAKTRSALLDRGKPDETNYEPVALSKTALAILRAVLQRILPQEGAASIDIAARIDAQLASGIGDGWRRVELPSDAAAYNTGLLTLDRQAQMQRGKFFVQLNGEDQDEILSAIGRKAPLAYEESAAVPDHFDIAQMALWLADLRADAVQIYISHPATLDKMGYSGIANGGDGLPKTGFVEIGVDRVEDWEPPAKRSNSP